MLVPISWIKEYVDMDFSPDELKAALVACGFEVEAIHDLSKKTENIFTAKIIKCDKHPSSEKLNICQVTSLNDRIFTIVTNDSSLIINDIVPLAIDGSVLNDGSIIHKSFVKEVMSDGMFCGLKDLGLSETDYPSAISGVLKFAPNTKVGINVNKIIGRDEIVLDISITANRSDANSILGIAREVSAITGNPIKKTFSTDYLSYPTNDDLSCIVNDYQRCKRYMACVVNNITVTDSPEYIKSRLRSVGIKPINNIVDLTNYVMISVGQPMHAFDYDKILGSKIEIRLAREAETIKTLNGNIYNLDETMLTICNPQEPMAIAGIMGGLEHSITQQTQSIVLESANFARDSVRSTARFLGLQSESSLRFEKGIDFYSQELGLILALDIIKENNWGKPVSLYDSLNKTPDQKIITFSCSDISRILGINIDSEGIVKSLESLGFQVTKDREQFSCTVPRWRDDICGINDIAEEIIRSLGYDRFNKVSNNRIGTITLGQKGSLFAQQEKAKEVLLGEGYGEVVNYSFIPKNALDDMNCYELYKNTLIELLNPLSEEYSIMRPFLAYSMIRVLAKNYIRGNNNVRLFELAKTYNKIPNQVGLLPEEKYTLCIGSYGTDFFDIKTTVDKLLYSFRYNVIYKENNLSYMHPFINALIIDSNTGKNIGYVGEVKNSISESIFNIPEKIFIAELDFDYLHDNYQGYKDFKNISRFQLSERDISIVIDNEILAQEIIETIKNAASNILTDVYIFDVYTGPQVGDNQKSVALTLRFQSMAHTLNETEINLEMDNIYKSLKINFDANLR